MMSVGMRYKGKPVGVLRDAAVADGRALDFDAQLFAEGERGLRRRAVGVVDGERRRGLEEYRSREQGRGWRQRRGGGGWRRHVR